MEQKPSTSFLLDSLPVYAPTTVLDVQPPRCLQLPYCRRRLEQQEEEESSLTRRVHLIMAILFSLLILGVVVFIIMDMCGFTDETPSIIPDFVIN